MQKHSSNAGYRILFHTPTFGLDATVHAALAAAGHTTALISDSAMATEQIASSACDLAVIEATDDALALIDAAIGATPRVALLALSAPAELDMRLRALHHGAMDYVLTTAGAEEWLARIVTLMRRGERAATRHLLERDGIVLDQQTSRLGYGRRWTELTPSEMLVFRELLSQLRNPVPKARLRSCLPEGAQVSNNAIEVLIHRLRAKILPQGLSIRAHRGAGYVLEQQSADAKAQPLRAALAV